MAKRNRSSQAKREREQKKRDRQRRKAEKAATKRDRRFGKSNDEVDSLGPDVQVPDATVDDAVESATP